MAVKKKLKHLIVLFNPSSAIEQSQKNLMGIINKLNSHEILYHFIQTESEQHLRELSRTYATETILGVGGDSTITIIAHEVINELRKKKKKIKPKIAMIGTGSSNDLMLDYNLINIDKIFFAIKNNQWKTIDVGEVTIGKKKYIFLGQCNIGIGVYVNRKVEYWKTNKKFWARWQMFSGLIAVIFFFIIDRKPLEVKVSFNEHYKVKIFEKKVILLLFSKIRYWATGKLFVPKANLNDKKLHSVIIEKMGFWNFLKMTINSSKGNHLTMPLVNDFNSKEVLLEFDKPQAIQIDGDIVKDKTGEEVSAKKIVLNCLTMIIQIPEIE